jgi:hypothetical protein
VSIQQPQGGSIQAASGGGAIIDFTKYDRSKYNLLLPASIIQTQNQYVMTVQQVEIDPDHNHGEVFKVGSRQENGKWINVLSLAKPSIDKFAAAAGIVLDPAQCGFLVQEKRYVVHQTVGAMRLPNGQWVTSKCTKEIDLDVIEDKLTLQFEEKCEDAGWDAAKKYKTTKRTVGKGDNERTAVVIDPEDRERFIRESVRANMIVWRENKNARAETGSRLRLIRTLLGIKSTFTPDELRKPFIVPRVDFVPDLTDPEQKRMAVLQGMKAQSELFGGRSPVMQPRGFAGATHVEPVADEDAYDYNTTSSIVPDYESESSEDSTSDAQDQEQGAQDAGTQEQQGQQPQTQQSGGQQALVGEAKTEAKAGPKTCQHPGCSKVLNEAEIKLSEKLCTGYYCALHQRLHKKV